MKNYSLENVMYLKRMKKEKIFIIVSRFFIILFFLFLWEFLSRVGIINTFLFSSPSRICNTICGLIKDGSFFKHFNITIFEVIAGFILSNIFGFIIAVLFLISNKVYKIFDPYITVLNSLPKVALGPLIIIWIGSGIKSIVFMSLLISVFITIINIYNGFISVNKNYITMLKSFGASNLDVFFKIILPSNIYNIISTLKINVSMNLIGVIMGELLVSKNGIGYLIMYGSQVFNIDLVITGIFILGFISYIMYYLIEKVELKYNFKR